MSPHRAVWLASVLAASGPGTLAGQQRARVVVPELVAIARGNLAFGEVFRGVPSMVPATGPNAAQFEISTPHLALLQVTLLLPDALRSASGEALPLAFRTYDGVLVKQGGKHPHSQVFDPAAPVVITVDGDERLFVKLGGTAQPTGTQGLGQYRATLTVIVVDLGT